MPVAGGGKIGAIVGIISGGLSADWCCWIPRACSLARTRLDKAISSASFTAWKMSLPWSVVKVSFNRDCRRLKFGVSNTVVGATVMEGESAVTSPMDIKRKKGCRRYTARRGLVTCHSTTKLWSYFKTKVTKEKGRLAKKWFPIPIMKFCSRDSCERQKSEYVRHTVFRLCCGSGSVRCTSPIVECLRFLVYVPYSELGDIWKWDFE
jgi:hypothetical protein